MSPTLYKNWQSSYSVYKEGIANVAAVQLRRAVCLLDVEDWSDYSDILLLLKESATY
jgi:hypothetical protein